MAVMLRETRGSDTPRVQRLKARMMKARETDKVDIIRARLATASYKETEGQSWAIRKARAFEKVLKELPIYIGEEELIVGEFSSEPGARKLFPEIHAERSLQEFTGEKGDLKAITPEQRGEVIEMCQWWRDKCLENIVNALYSEEDRKWRNDIDQDEWCAGVMVAPQFLRSEGMYNAVDFAKPLRIGVRGMIKEVEDELAGTPIRDADSLRKVEYLKATKIVLEALIEFAHRYVRAARVLADSADGPRRAELLRTAEACAWAPEHPPRNFFEALQGWWLVYVASWMEGATAGIPPGRFDQYMYPYYQRDKEADKITDEEVIELLSCLRVKASSYRRFKTLKSSQSSSGELIYHVMTVSGQTPDGRDATNELSYLLVESAHRTGLPHFSFAIRYHQDMPEEFAMKALEVVSMGLGFPSWFNDAITIKALTGYGIPLEEARDYCLHGCIHTLPSRGAGNYLGPWLNAAKCLELAMHDGVDPKTGWQVGPKTGKFEDFDTYEKFEEAFNKQIAYFIKRGGDLFIVGQIKRGEVYPLLLASAMADGCLKSGKDMSCGGARTQWASMLMSGMINAADSLAAVKKRVYEDRSITKPELLEALAANFKGKEEIRRLLLSAPKFGNDNDYVDKIAVRVYDHWTRTAISTPSLCGETWRPAPYSISIHFPLGKVTGALPSGRLAGDVLTEGCLSPEQGMDVEGPTAVVNSAAKVDQSRWVASLMNQKFTPSVLKTRSDLKKLYALIQTYFENGGKQIQFNVVSRDTMVDAQKHPEKHRDLVVRVAGYSVFFIELHREVQDEIIRRTEQPL